VVLKNSNGLEENSETVINEESGSRK